MEVERLQIRVNTSTSSAERDLGKLEAKADAAARDRTIHVDIDTKSFNESLDRLERSMTRMGRQGGAAKSMDRFASSSLRAKKNARALSIVMTSLKFPLVAAGGNAAASGVSALAVGFTGLTAAVGPAVGLLGVVPGLFASIGQGAFALAGAFTGVGDVFKALDNVETVTTANQRYGGGVDQLRQQERALALAQREAMDAQDGLARARILAARDIEDAELSLEQSYLSERRAVRALEEAQKRLARGRQATNDAAQEHVQFTDDFTGKVYDAIRVSGGSVTDESYNEADALMDVQQAELDLRAIRTQRARQEEDMIDLQRRGIDGHELMVDATRRLADAQWSLQEASAIAAAGVTDMSKATDELDDALSKVHPAVESFARYIYEDVKEAFIALRREMQGDIFPGLELAVRGAMTNFDLLRDGVLETSGILGDFFFSLADWTTSPEFRQDFQEILSINNDLLRDMSDVALDVIEGFGELIITSGPLLDWFGDLATKSSELFRIWAEDDSGELADFFERTVEVSEKLFESFGNVYDTMKNIGRAAEPLATWILDSLVRITDEQAKWTGSAEGIETMAGYFDRMRAPLSEIAGLTGDIARGLFEIGTPEQLADMVSLLREDLVPSLIRFFDAVDDGFGPAVIEGVSDFVDLFTTLVDDGGGGFTTFVETLGDMAEVLKWFINHIPGLDHIVGTLLTLKGVQLAFNVTGFSRLIGAAGATGGMIGGLKGIFTSTARNIEVDMARAASAGEGFATTMGSVTREAGRGVKGMASQIRGAFSGANGLLATFALGYTAIKMWGDMMDEAKRKGEEFARGRYAPATDALANAANQAGTYDTILGLENQANSDRGVANAENATGFMDQIMGRTDQTMFSWVVDVDARREIEAIGDAAEATAAQMNPLRVQADSLATIFGVSREKAADFVIAQRDLGITFDSSVGAVKAYAEELNRLNNNELQETYDKTTDLFDATLAYELRSMDTEDQLAAYRKEELDLAQALHDGSLTTEEAAAATRDFERDTIRMAQGLNDEATAAVTAARRNAELQGKTLDASEAARIHREKLAELTGDLDPTSPLAQRMQGLIGQLQAIQDADLKKDIELSMDISNFSRLMGGVENVLNSIPGVEVDFGVGALDALAYQLTHTGVPNREVRLPGGGIAREGGGRYWAGTAMLTGEGGPELQIPDRGGYIMNNTDTAALLAGLKQFLEGGGGGGRPINIEQHFHERIDPAAVGREVAWAVE